MLGTPASLAIADRTFGTSLTGSSVRVCTRTWSLPTVVTVASSRSGTPEFVTASCMSVTVVSVTAVWTWKSAPPSNSMPHWNPRIPMDSRETAIRIAEMTYQRRRWPTKS